MDEALWNYLIGRYLFYGKEAMQATHVWHDRSRAFLVRREENVVHLLGVIYASVALRQIKVGAPDIQARYILDQYAFRVVDDTQMVLKKIKFMNDSSNGLVA